MCSNRSAKNVQSVVRRANSQLPLGIQTQLKFCKKKFNFARFCPDFCKIFYDSAGPGSELAKYATFEKKHKLCIEQNFQPDWSTIQVLEHEYVGGMLRQFANCSSRQPANVCHQILSGYVFIDTASFHW